MSKKAAFTSDKERINLVIKVLESLYGESSDQKYFLAKSKTVSDVRNEISKQLEDVGLDKNRIDLYVMISQIDDDVFIKVT